MVDIKQLLLLIKEKKIPDLKEFIKANDLEIRDGKLYYKDSKQVKEWVGYYDKRQYVKKILLNSTYGAITNAYCRFNDRRIGQSTTLSGRTIAKHMDAFTNQCLTGEYDHVGKSIIYGDTDSVYFSAWPIIKDEVAAGTLDWDKEICVQLYDAICEQVNDSFPEACRKAFHAPPANGAIIRGGRELVAIKGLYITKKRYAVLIYDKEGKRLDVNGSPGKVKAMGLDLKRSDTPKVVQAFLSELLLDVLQDCKIEHLIEKINKFKKVFQELPPWQKGTPKRVNNLTTYGHKVKVKSTTAVPGHVRAALNWNTLLQIHSDHYSMPIRDGMKTIVCKLKPNPMGFTSVGIPIDELHLPQWFTDLPFDQDIMEDKIVDKKIENLLGDIFPTLRSDTSNNQNILNSFFTFK